MTEPLLHSVAESADLLRVSTRTLSRMIERGELPVVKFGARVLLDHRDLLALINRFKITENK